MGELLPCRKRNRLQLIPAQSLQDKHVNHLSVHTGCYLQLLVEVLLIYCCVYAEGNPPVQERCFSKSSMFPANFIYML